MNDSIAILGRQPQLSLAELESLYGPEALTPLDKHAVLIKKPPGEIDFHRLGGTIKLAQTITQTDTVKLEDIISNLGKNILPERTKDLPEGKIRLGLNLYGFKEQTKDINKLGLKLKKYIKDTGRSIRVVPNTDPQLSSAQSLHNQLGGPTGIELVIVKSGSSVWLAQVINIQDIRAYTARDQKRPKRDAKVGMLPPKLAQIIINLANPADSATILDPFCGSGVVLQEALLMGHDVIGTDIDQRMVDFAKENITEWLPNHSGKKLGQASFETGDATTFQWRDNHAFDAVAAETYLGKPLFRLPRPEELNRIINETDAIQRGFLENLARQTAAGFRLCLAVPAWKTPNGFKHLPTLDYLDKLGYTRLSFVHAKNPGLIYHRKDQIVGRELMVLQRT